MKKKILLWCKEEYLPAIIRRFSLLHPQMVISEIITEENNSDGIDKSRIIETVCENGIECAVIDARSTGLQQWNNIWGRIQFIKELGIKEIYAIPSEMTKKRRIKIFLFEHNNFLVPIEKWRELPVAKFMISEKCNLNCAGCTHFAPLIDNPQDMRKEEYREYLKQLKRVFGFVKEVNLLGGEPLLNDKLKEIIIETRNILPYADISIVTNGLLITRMSDELIDVIKSCGVFFLITFYKPSFDREAEIRAFLEENGIKYILTDRVGNFRIQYNLKGDSNRESIHRTCLDKYCHTIYRGKIYNCYYPATVRWAESKLGVNIPWQSEGIDIFSLKRKDAPYAIRKLALSMNICRYCNGFDDCQYKEWKQYNSKSCDVYDWFLENPTC